MHVCWGTVKVRNTGFRAWFWVPPSLASYKELNRLKYQVSQGAWHTLIPKANMSMRRKCYEESRASCKTFYLLLL